MRATFFAIAVVLVLILDRGLCAADEKTYSLGEAGTLHLSLPQGWTGDDDSQAPPTVTLKAAAGKQVTVQITPLPEMTDEKLKTAATMIGDHYAKGSKEEKTTLETISGKDIHGFVSSFTDAAPKPGEFQYVTTGAVKCGDTTLAVTVLYNDKTGADRAAAMESLKTFSITGGKAALPKEMRVKSPDGTWTLVVPGTWKVSEDNKTAGGKGRQITAASDDGNYTLTVFLDL